MTRETALMMAGMMMAGWTHAAQPPIRFISHRGESMDAPENTMAAFRLSRERGVFGFECDIYMTADNEIVCLHDSTAKRTGGLDVKPSQATLAELQALDAGSWKGPQFKGERMPTLDEALALARDGFEIYVEIKCGTEILPRLAEVIAAEPKATPERVLFICFSADVVTAVRRQLPAYRTYWLTGTGPKKDGAPGPTATAIIEQAKACRASGVDAQDSSDITPEFVKAVRSAGLSFHIWTVNNAPRARALAAMGVETVTTDCGAALKNALYGGPADERPVIHWTFDGAPTNSGTGGPRHDAVLSGAPLYAAGVRGQGLRLDGRDDFAGAPCQLAERGTVALWFKPDEFYNFNTLLDSDASPDLWEMWIYKDGRLKFRIAGGSGELSYDLKELGGAGAWYHLAVVWDLVDTGEARLYVNGVEREVAPAKRLGKTGGRINIGGGNAGNTKGKGVVDDVRVYGVPLSKARIRSLASDRDGQRPAPDVAIDEHFEGELPGFHTHLATYAADGSRAHCGKGSLRVTPSKEAGGAYFKLDGLLDFTSDYEFSAWVLAGADGAASLYVSASDGKGRHTLSSAGGGKAGQWVRLRGVIRAGQWRPRDRDIMLALSTRGESWFDDAELRKTELPDPAIGVWPRLESRLNAAAGSCAVSLAPGQRVELDARQGALAPALDRVHVVTVSETSVQVPANGLLTFAVNVKEPLYVTGELELEPDADLRPGLRAYVLSDDTLVGAPMVKAAPWRNIGGKETAPAPAVTGAKPASTVKLAEWRLDPGRHTLTVAGPHMRPAGLFRRLTLHALPRPVKKPLYTFALFADTHLGEGRPEWMNVKMDGPAIAELEASLKRLRAEGVSFAFIAGDMTDGGRPSQVASLAQAIQRAGLPVYGCIGNHEVFTPGSRTNLTATLPDLFPAGKTQYVLDRPPLRFVVLDGTWWRDRSGNALEVYDRSNAVRVAAKPCEVDWLKKALAADTRTPTLALWHYPFYSSRGETSCGYQLGQPIIWDAEVLALLEAAPNVVATLNGHMHYNTVDIRRGIACLQNAAFAEWPNLYRVLRVYPDRIEWEVRQVHNRGFVSEGVLPEKALTWMISIREGDLAGSVSLAPQARGQTAD